MTESGLDKLVGVPMARERRRSKPKTKVKSTAAVPTGFELIHTFRGFKGSNWSIAWSPDGRFLATPMKGEVGLWDTESGELQRVLPTNAGRFLTWSPDSRLLALGSSGGAIEIWNVDSGDLQHTLAGQTDLRIWSLEWSPDGRGLPPDQEMA